MNQQTKNHPGTNQEPPRHQGLFLTCEPKWKVLPPLGGKQKKALTHSKGGEDHLFNYHQRDFPHHHLCDTKKSFDTFKRKECNDMPSYITCDLLIHLVQQKKRYQVPGFLFGEDVRTHADCDGRNGKNIFGTALHCVSSKVWYSSQSLNVGLYCSFFRNQKFDDILKDIRFFEVRAAGVGGEGIGQLGLEKLKSQVVFVCFFVFAFFIVFMYYLGLCVSFVFVFYFCFTFFCVCVF